MASHAPRLRTMLSQAWAVRFYALALVVQKGLPVLALPLIVGIFGRTAFGEYVLLYSAVQIWATISAIGTPLAVVPLWYREERPLVVAGDAHGLLLALTVGFAVAASATLLLLPSVGDSLAAQVGLSRWHAAWLVVVFGYFYNVNQLALAAARAREWQARYFVAALVGGAVLAVGLLAAKSMVGPSLTLLVVVQAAAVLGGTAPLIDRKILMPFRAGANAFKRHVRMILSQSSLLAAYTLVTLVAMSIDKWAAKGWFPLSVYNAYAIDYQAAFTMMFVPTAINLYNGPALSRLTAAGDAVAVKREMARARIVSTVGAAAVALAMAAYGWITHLGLTRGFWILAVGFLFESNFIVMSNRLMAMLRPGQLLGISVGCLALYALALTAVGLSGIAILLYFAMPLYAFAMLAAASWRLIRLG